MSRKLTERDYVIVGSLVLAAAGGVFVVKKGSGVFKPITKMFEKESGKGDTGLETSEEEAEVAAAGENNHGFVDGRTLASGGASAEMPVPTRPKGYLPARVGKDSEGRCLSVEYPGYGAKAGKFSEEEWGKVQAHFTAAKGSLSKWLNDQTTTLTPDVRKVMTKKLGEVTLSRSPTRDELDLSWRGILAFVQGPKGTLRVGSGYRDLVANDAKRARFEMVRALSQAWAPCEMTSANVKQPWGTLLTCMGLSPEESCNVGSYSDGGWAVSSAIAQAVSDPGCQVPALASSSAKACVSSLKDKAWAGIVHRKSEQSSGLLSDSLRMPNQAHMLSRAEPQLPRPKVDSQGSTEGVNQ